MSRHRLVVTIEGMTTVEVSPHRLARIAGLLYLVAAMGALIPEIVRSGVVLSGDATATADGIRASAKLFRLVFVIEVMAAVPWLVTLLALYLLLKHVNQIVAVAMVLFAAVGTAVGTLNLLNEYAALTIATDQAFTRTFGEAGADALVLLFASMHGNGVMLNAVFYGPWLVPLGYLVIRSGYFPKLLGVLLIIACCGYLMLFFTTVLAPSAAAAIRPVVLAIGGVGEIGFMVWLVAKGARVPFGAPPVPAVLNQPQP